MFIKENSEIQFSTNEVRFQLGFIVNYPTYIYIYIDILIMSLLFFGYIR